MEAFFTAFWFTLGLAAGVFAVWLSIWWMIRWGIPMVDSISSPLIRRAPKIMMLEKPQENPLK